MYPDIFQNGDFFFRVSAFRFRAPKTRAFENGSRKGVCLKTPAYRFPVRGRK